MKALRHTGLTLVEHTAGKALQANYEFTLDKAA